MPKPQYGVTQPGVRSVIEGTGFVPRQAKGKNAAKMDFSAPYGRTATASPITQSQVNTQSPYTSSQLYQQTQARPVYPGYGTSSGDRTRQAFAQAAAMQQGNNQRAAFEDLDRDYRQQQQQTRAADIESMRADQARRYGMDEDYIAKRRNQEIQRYERLQDLRNARREASRDRDTAIGENITGLLLSSTMPVLQQGILENWGMGGQANGVQRLPSTLPQRLLGGLLR